MMPWAAEVWHLLQRHIRATIRMPIWIAIALVQPVLWITIYGQLFRRVVDIPGFHGDSYIQFLTPGIIVMNAFFASVWSGTSLLRDLDDGVMDRFLATPVHRSAIIVARVAHVVVTVIVQSIIILVLGIVLGARVSGGLAGILAVLLIAALLGIGGSALSIGAALMTRREETLVAVLNFFGLPLTFLSSAFMASNLMPSWIRVVARFNPVNWAVDGARASMTGQAWSSVGIHAMLLVSLALLSGLFALRAFSGFRRTT